MSDTATGSAVAADLPDPASDFKIRTAIALDNNGKDQVDRPKIDRKRAEELRRVVGDDPRPLRDGRLACMTCGVAVEASTPELVVPVFGSNHVDGSAVRLTAEVPLGRCTDCTDRHQLAEQIARTHPQAQRAIGGLLTARIDHVLAGLTVITKPLPGPDVSDAVLGSLLRTVGPAAAAISWSDAPKEGMCAPFPFGHVRPSGRAGLLRAWVAHQADVAAAGLPDVDVRPPAAEPPGPGMPLLGGCLYCGRASIRVSARRARLHPGPTAFWTARIAASTASLGGPTTPHAVRGWVCGRCDQAIESEGAIGPTSIQAALTRWVEASGDQEWAAALRRQEWAIPTWAANAVSARLQGRSLAPNARAWGHVGRSEFLRPRPRQHSEIWGVE